MRIKFQADEDLNGRLVAAVKRREPGVDFMTAHDSGIKGFTDAQVLEAAARLGRLLVTHDLRTMPGEFGRFVQARHSPGVILVPQRLPLTTVAEDLILVWAATEAEEWLDGISSQPL